MLVKRSKSNAAAAGVSKGVAKEHAGDWVPEEEVDGPTLERRFSSKSNNVCFSILEKASENELFCSGLLMISIYALTE